MSDERKPKCRLCVLDTMVPPKPGRAHYNLDAWKISRRLVSAVYLLTQSFPKEELFGLVSQMRRAAVSILSNIAEGAARTGDREYAQFVSLARGSLSELETQLLIAADLGYIKESDAIFSMVDQASRLITGLHKVVRHSSPMAHRA